MEEIDTMLEESERDFEAGRCYSIRTGAANVPRGAISYVGHQKRA